MTDTPDDNAEDLLHTDTSLVYFQGIVVSTLYFHVLFSKVGAVLNVFHLIVLTRKTFITSSVNVIMIGIASCDLFMMLQMITSEHTPTGTDCTPPPSRLKMRLDWFFVSARMGFRQCSAWLAVLISLITYLIITDIKNQRSRFSKPSYGIKAVASTFSLSLMLSFFYFMNYQFVQTAIWRPKATCEDYSPTWEEPIFSQKYINLFEIHDGLFSRIRLIVEGLIIKLIPSLLLPVLTGLLIYELHKAEKKYGSSIASAARKEARKSQNDRTTIMVIFVAISFLLSEFPTGFCEVSAAIWGDDPTAESIVEVSLWVELLFSKLGAFLNVFHLVILTRRSMMTSSINVIMIGIGCCDLLLMLDIIRTSLTEPEPAGSTCAPPPSLLKMRVDWSLVSVHMGLRQCSAWLAVLISLITYLIITDISNQNNKYATLSYGYRTIAATFVMSCILSLFYFWNYQFVEVATWYPDSTCQGHFGNYTEPIYTVQYAKFFETNDGLLSKVWLLLEGVIIKIIPCFLLPTLTGLLIYEMRKTARKFGNVSVAQKEARKSQQDRTTVIVIFVAITFLLSEFPTGLFEIVEALWHTSPLAERLSKTVTFLCDAVFTVNSSIHFMINFSMSLQYRKTVYRLLRFPSFKKNSNVVTVVQNVAKSRQNSLQT